MKEIHDQIIIDYIEKDPPDRQIIDDNPSVISENDEKEDSSEMKFKIAKQSPSTNDSQYGSLETQENVIEKIPSELHDFHGNKVPPPVFID